MLSEQEIKTESDLGRYDVIIKYYEENPSRFKSSLQNRECISQIHEDVAKKFSGAYQKARELSELRGIDPDTDSKEVREIAEAVKLPEMIEILEKINLLLKK